MAYTPKVWSSNDLLTSQAMNNIETGIQEALSQTTTINQTAADAISQVDSIRLSILDDLNSARAEMGSFQSTIEANIDTQLSTNTNSILTLLQRALGVPYYNINSLSWTLPEGNQTIDARITELYTEIFGESSNENPSATSLNSRVQTLISDLATLTSTVSSNQTELYSRVKAALGGSYYDIDTQNWSLGQKKSVDTRINEIYEAIFGEDDPNNESTTSLIDQLSQLNTAIFGSAEGGSANGSLIDKIEGALGRSIELDEANEEEADEETGEYSNSIMALIRQLQGVLGIAGGDAGGASSNLVQNVNSLMEIIYGTTIINGETVIDSSSIAHTLREIVGSFYDTTISIYDQVNNTTTTQTGRLDQLVSSLSSNIATIIQDNATNTSAISTINATLQDLSPAYIDAGSEPIGENNYLILKRTNGKTEQTPASESELEAAINAGTLKNTYIKLPQGGGGGGVAAYDYTAQIIDTPIANTSLNVGDICNLTFIWQVTDINNSESYIPLSGTLQIIINNSIVLTDVIDSNTTRTINLGSYITSAGRKNITITVSHNAVPNKSRYYTITAYNANLLVNLNTEQNFSGELITIPYLATIGSTNIGKTLKVFIDDEEEPIATNTTFSETNTSISIATPSIGAHLLTIFFISNINENLQIVSNVYHAGIICRATVQEFIAADLEDGFEIKQYENLSFNYIVGSALTSIDTYNVNISINGNDYPREVPSLTQTNFTMPINFTGSLHIILTTTNASYEITGSVVPNTNYTFELQGSESLIFNLPTDNRSNQESVEDRIKWENDAEENYLNMVAQQKFNKSYNELTTAQQETITSPTITLSNFLFSDGYDGWSQDENGKSFLRLRNTDTVTIENFPLFKQNNIADNITFEIEFKTSEVVNANTIFFNQRYRDDTTAQQAAINRELEIRAEMQEFGRTDDYYADETRDYKTYTDFALTELLSILQEKVIISLTPQEMTIYNSFVSRLQYKEEEITTISYVINGQSNNNGDDSQLIYTYINGVLSNIGKYASLIGYNSIGDIVIGSPECTVDIYAIRVYNTNLTSQQIVNNWVYGISDLTERTLAYDRNNYPMVDRNSIDKNIITPDTFELCSPGTPYMIIKARGDLKDSGAMPQAKGSDLATTVDIEYVDRLNEKNSFTANGVKVQVQGTSSQFYPRKNYKIKMSTFVQNNITHKKKVTAEDYVDGNTSGSLKDNITKKGYKLSDSSVPVFDFCLKADYASSEGVNNTGLVALYEKLVQANQAWQTEPQKLQTSSEKKSSQIRQGVEGYPIVIFYLDTVNHANDDPIFLGKYNFNNDKGTHDVFGLKTFQKNWYYDALDSNEKIPLLDEDHDYLGDESWEGADNFYPLNVFRPYINGANSHLLGPEKWAQAFPARFPGAWEDATDTGKGGPSAVESLVPDRRALQEVIAWVYSTRTEVLKQREDNTWYDACADENDPDYVGPDITNNLTREQVLANNLQKFKTEFSNYFNLNAMLLFYCFTEFFLMVDNRAKNVFWTRYITTENRDSTALLAAENQTYGKWLTLPYDFDTAMGINNQGEFQFDYHYEDGEFLPSGQLVFNGQPSILFTNFRKAFSEEIGTTFTNMFRTVDYGFDYKPVEDFFEKHQNAWSETVFNEDARVKYISEHANYSMAQGSKKEQRRWWLSNRFRYIQSKYQYAVDTLYIRANKTGTISVETYADAYVSFQFGAGAGSTITTERVLQGQTKTLTIDGTANNAVVNIFPASCLKSVNGISQLLVDTIDLSACTRLQSIRIGSALDNPNRNLTTANFTLNENNKILRLLDLRRCNGPDLTSLDLSMCSSLEKVYLADTQLTSIGLPNGGILKTVQYPAGITAIKIQNQPYLENLIIGNALPLDEMEVAEIGYTNEFNQSNNNYSTLNSVYLNNVGENIDTLAIIRQISGNAYVYMDNVLWTVTGEDFATNIFPKINNMLGFENGQANNEAKSDIRGKLRLTTDLPEGLELLDIAQRFPFLSIVKLDNQGNEQPFYTVNFYNFVNEIIETQLIAGNDSAVDHSSTLIANGSLERIISQDGKTRQGFGGWDKSLQYINSNLSIYPVPVTEYRVDFIVDDQNIELDIPNPFIVTGFFKLGESVTLQQVTALYRQPLPTFIRSYNDYAAGYLINEDDSLFSGAMPLTVPEDIIILKVGYNITPHVYSIKILNTDEYGQPDYNNPIAVLRRVVNTTPRVYETVNGEQVVIGNSISYNSLSRYLNDDTIAMINSGEINTPWAERRYQFLNWSPFINPGSSLMVTGDMDIKLLYYDKQDYFTNYFVDKMTECNFTQSDGVTILPYGAFSHNSNLERLECYATEIKDYALANFNTIQADKRIFIFKSENSNITLGNYCFYGITSAIIIFETTGQITMGRSCFSGARDCTIVLRNSNYAIRGNADFNDFLNQSGANQNRIFVTQRAKDEYRTNDNLIPNGLKGVNVDSIQLISAWEGLGE